MTTTLSPHQYIEKLRSDFIFFMHELWADRGLDKVAPLGWVEDDMLDFAYNGPNRQVLLGWRGAGKTTLLTCGLTCYDLFLDPNAKLLIVSKSGGEAKNTVHQVREWIEHVPFLQHLAPRERVRSNGAAKSRDTTWYFDVRGAAGSRNPSVMAKGIDSQITGTRASRLIGDDIETPSNTRTVEARELLADSTREFTNIARFGRRCINLLGTYHHEESVYKKLPDRGYTVRSYPIVAPHPDDVILNMAPAIQDRIDDGRLKPSSARNKFDGDRIAPWLVSPDDLAERMAEGISDFAKQGMLIADLDDTLLYPLKLRNLIVFDVPRDKAPHTIAWGLNNHNGSTVLEDVPSYGFSGDRLHGPIFTDAQLIDYTGCRMWIDPAGRSGGRSDSTGISIIAQCNGYLYLKHVDAFQDGYGPDTLNAIAHAAREHRVTMIEIEDVALQGMMAPLLEPVVRQYFLEPGDDDAHPDGWKCSVEAIRMPLTQKEIKIIQALEPVMANHRLVIDRSVAVREDFQTQLTRLTSQRGCLKHDDLIEAVSANVHRWREQLNLDPQVMADRRREQAYFERLRHYESIGKPQDRGPRWFRHH